MVRNVKFNTAKLAQDLGVSEVVAKLLVNRGIYNLDIANGFLDSSIDNLWSNKSPSTNIQWHGSGCLFIISRNMSNDLR